MLFFTQQNCQCYPPFSQYNSFMLNIWQFVIIVIDIYLNKFENTKSIEYPILTNQHSLRQGFPVVEKELLFCFWRLLMDQCSSIPIGLKN